jgi:hypothetical protein
LRFYRKERSKASKNSQLLEPGVLEVEQLSEDDGGLESPKAQISSGKPHAICQRVEDNAFHQLELSALFRFR